MNFLFSLLMAGTLLTPSHSDLQFSSLASSWDEGVPLGNATVGELVWQKNSVLRFSLDRSDLWDLRPADSLVNGDHFRYRWLREMIDKEDYDAIHDKFDIPYHDFPGPSKIACAALEFPAIGEVKSVRLYLKDALCRVEWKSGVSMMTFISAGEPVGWFVFSDVKDKNFHPSLVPPRYNEPSQADEATHTGIDLQSLGYDQGQVRREKNGIVYHQEGWGGFSYDVVVKWRRSGAKIIGVWSVTSSLSSDKAEKKAEEALARGFEDDFKAHRSYWNAYWAKSSINLPDPVLQKQYDNEMYKFASVSREDSCPISLQAVWTADNGLLPPWKGDFHNDLNTQMSYWPAYTGNHLSEGMSCVNTMWKQRDTYRSFTKSFFETDGIVIPGVETLDGKPMGGWPQYSLSPTVAAWMSQNFYLQWEYSADKKFLLQRGYPFVREVATALEGLTFLNDEGVRTLPVSTSPEIHENSPQSWFSSITNFDLALIRFAFGAAARMAQAAGEEEQALHWSALLHQMPDYDLDEDGALTIASGNPIEESHRHFSPAVAIFPLGLIDLDGGEESRRIIKATINRLDQLGSSSWCGYSFAWLGNLKARARDGEGAADALRTFAECFCLPNTFHANGDQSRSGKSRYTYRPFTLEGNFAFASGVQQMLLQSQSGVIRIFPAVPSSWKNVSFTDLRAVGAFLVSAEMKDGVVISASVYSEKGGRLSVIFPGDSSPRNYDTKAGQKMIL